MDVATEPGLDMEATVKEDSHRENYQQPRPATADNGKSPMGAIKPALA
jgi:hypothetical protein